MDRKQLFVDMDGNVYEKYDDIPRNTQCMGVQIIYQEGTEYSLVDGYWGKSSSRYACGDEEQYYEVDVHCSSKDAAVKKAVNLLSRSFRTTAILGGY